MRDQTARTFILLLNRERRARHLGVWLPQCGANERTSERRLARTKIAMQRNAIANHELQGQQLSKPPESCFVELECCSFGHVVCVFRLQQGAGTPHLATPRSSSRGRRTYRRSRPSRAAGCWG
jgi:hypothetical protein